MYIGDQRIQNVKHQPAADTQHEADGHGLEHDDHFHEHNENHEDPFDGIVFLHDIASPFNISISQLKYPDKSFILKRKEVYFVEITDFVQNCWLMTVFFLILYVVLIVFAKASGGKPARYPISLALCFFFLGLAESGYGHGFRPDSAREILWFPAILFGIIGIGDLLVTGFYWLIGKMLREKTKQ